MILEFIEDELGINIMDVNGPVEGPKPGQSPATRSFPLAVIFTGSSLIIPRMMIRKQYIHSLQITAPYMVYFFA